MSLLNFTEWFSCSDTFVPQVGSSKERRYLSPEAKNTVSSKPVPNTLSVIVAFFFLPVGGVSLINGGLLSVQSWTGKLCRVVLR